jgi:ComF family protein
MNFRPSLSIYSAGKRAFDNAIDFIFPGICIVCRNSIDENKWLCNDCIDLLDLNNSCRDACPFCSQNRKIRKCTCEYNRKELFENSFSIFDFDNTIKDIVHEFKYNGLKALAFDMGKKYAGKVPESFLAGMDMMVSVPLFFMRFINRGYNQAEYFAKGLESGLNKKIKYIPDILIRKRHTGTQTVFSRNRRLVNVASAFSVFPWKKGLIQDKNIIIVDDVITTSATVTECAKTLRSAGCGNIRVLSFARD